VKTIGKHVGNALKEELVDSDNRVVAKFATTASDGKTYQVEPCSLDMILSVGYRVKSQRGVEFRRWATDVLRRYIVDGHAENEKRSSLYFMVDAGKDMYSYKINFGKYVEDQTFHGLDELNLQNNFVDASSIKESMAYWLFNRMGVDAPLSEARPMWNWILCDENYLGEYHDALLELVGVIDSGEFEEEAGRLYELILPYVEKDPKAIFTPDQFKKANATLLGFMELRADSVRRQADGQLATRSELQAEEGMVDASGISIGDMGSLEDLK